MRFVRPESFYTNPGRIPNKVTEAITDTDLINLIITARQSG